MRRKLVREEYANFLRKLLYSIDHIDWSGNRPAQMAILLCHLEKRHGSWPEEIKEDQEKAEEVIESFCKGEISEFELSEKIAELMKSLE
jgi:hypothetical protein